MGVSLECKNPKYSFDMGCGGFFNLRKNIAYALDKEFGELYERIIHCHGQDESDALDKETNEYFRKNSEKFDACEDVLDFLYTPDTGGKISYRTCKKIYDIIKDVDFEGKAFRYGAQQHNDYEEFKEFLLDCYSHRKNMTWF